MTSAIIDQAQQHLAQGQSRREVATELKIGLDTLKKAIHSGRLQEAKPEATPAFQASPSPNAADSKSERSAAAAECPMGKACHREDERVAAALGQLTSASIRFDPARDLKYGGVLCALPALEAVGRFDFLSQHFTLPRGYYDVMHVVSALAFMALLRIKTNEQLRFEDPGELGRLLGLDRIPEVKTFRLKIKAMCTEEAMGETGCLRSAHSKDAKDPDTTIGRLVLDEVSFILISPAFHSANQVLAPPVR